MKSHPYTACWAMACANAAAPTLALMVLVAFGEVPAILCLLGLLSLGIWQMSRTRRLIDEAARPCANPFGPVSARRSGQVEE